MVCPCCKNPIGNSSDFCIFCGRTFTPRGRNAARYCADEPKRKSNTGNCAQRLLYSATLIAALITFGAIWLSPAGRFTDAPVFVPANKTPVPTAAATPTTTPAASEEPAVNPRQSVPLEPTAGVTPAPTPDAAAAEEQDGVFACVSGEYPADLYMIEAKSADPQIQSNLDELVGDDHEGMMALNVDGAGNGTIQIDQAWFDPATVPVSAFVDNGIVSSDTLVGTIQQNDYQVTVTCICKNGSISGFIWLDNELTHIVVMFFG